VFNSLEKRYELPLGYPYLVPYFAPKLCILVSFERVLKCTQILNCKVLTFLLLLYLMRNCSERM